MNYVNGVSMEAYELREKLNLKCLTELGNKHRCGNRVRGDTEYGDWLNDPYYRKVSQKLPQEVRENNVRILETLPGIKRVPVRSR